LIPKKKLELVPSTTLTTDQSKAKEDLEKEERLSNRMMANRYKNFIHSSPTSLHDSKKRKELEDQEDQEESENDEDNAPSSTVPTALSTKKKKNKRNKKKNKDGQQGNKKARHVDAQGFMVPTKSD
jgi:hypothetical protein